MYYWKARFYLVLIVFIILILGFGIQKAPFLVLLVILFIVILSIVGYILHWNWKWNNIERINESVGITRKNTYIDKNGYLRWKITDKLCHRDIAWKNNIRHKTEQFGSCDIHHIDENKFNNTPENLEIFTREKHQLEHDQIIYEDGQKYVRLVPASRTRKETQKAILIGGKRGEWYPKSQLIVRNGYIYGTEWIVQKKRG